jgi:dTDP-glucose 4,6-dehydratase
MRILITGGAGFIGHHFCEHFVKLGWEPVVLDKLTYAGNMDRLRDTGIAHKVKLYTADFTRPITKNLVREIGRLDAIIHMGAETHVDNSITDPVLFAESNIIGTMRMMQAWEEARFFFFSTDEVFGPAPKGYAFKEGDVHAPSNPYAASKSAAEQMCTAFANTYGMDVTITRTMNVFGERQHPEKFIPLVIASVLHGDTVYIHSNKDRTEAGSRFYIHARNVADAYRHLLERPGRTGPVHIVGEREIDNLSLALSIAEIVGKPLRYEMLDFHSSRPGHDLRYALDGWKLASLGWTMPKNFDESLTKTVRWYLEHPEWLA